MYFYSKGIYKQSIPLRKTERTWDVRLRDTNKDQMRLPRAKGLRI